MLDGNSLLLLSPLMEEAAGSRGAVVPKQPVEIGEAAARCYEAGGSLIHFHVRDAQGRNSGAREIYAEVIRQISAGSGGRPDCGDFMGSNPPPSRKPAPDLESSFR